MCRVQYAGLWAFITAVLAIFGGAAAHATVTPSSRVGVCVAPESRYATPAAAFAGTRYDCSPHQYQLGPGNYWALSESVPPHLNDARRHLHVRVGSVWQRGLTLYVLYADGTVARASATSETLSRHIELGALIDFDIPYSTAAVTKLLWRVDGAANVRGILIDQHIVANGQGARNTLLLAVIYSGFAGLALALLVYNLAIWTALRYRFQLAYCAMVALMLVYAASSSGALAWAFPTLDNNVRIRINFATLAFAAAAALLFARTFFEEQIFGPWLRRATATAIILMAIVGAAFWPLSSIDVLLADRIYTGVLSLGIAMVVPILWQAWRRGSRFLWLFALAWAVPILFSVIRVLAAFHVVPRGFWLDNSTVLTLALESLLSSLAIAYRIQMLSLERDEAVAAEALARRLADADPLTGLLNRRAFLEQAIGREGPQALYIVDIDRFKTVNETIGHDGGDTVLRLFARTMLSSTPSGALVSRIGGEEFAILTDAMAPVDPTRLLARLRGARMPFDLTVTASIGSCTGPLRNEVDWKRLYHNADRALFDAKASGRDRAREGVPVPLAA